MDSLTFELKSKICASIHFDPSFGNMCITIMALSFCMLGCCASGLESVSCLGTSKKLNLGV